MKKFLNERNGKLFAKLFENQGIKLQINENIDDGWKIAADFDVIKIKTPEGYMGQESMDLAFPGAVTAEDVALELAGGDESMAKKIEYNLLRDDAFLAAVKSAQNDLDDYSAGQMEEGDYDMERAPDKFSPPLQKIAAKADTTPEIVAMFKWVKDQVKELTKGTATDLEIKKAFELVLKDMKNTIGKVVQDTTSEVHAAVNPYNSDVDQTDDEKKDLNTDLDR